MKNLCAIVLLTCLTTVVVAHDHWINQGGWRNPITNTWCCGDGDCEVVTNVTEVASGYRVVGSTFYQSETWNNYQVRREKRKLDFDEVVPWAEILPSQDTHFWRCKTPNTGERRCFFAPFPTT